MRTLVCLCLSLLPALVHAQTETKPAEAKQADPKRWDKAMAAFAKQDMETPFAPGGIVFTGSSSIALWKDVAKQFPEHKVLNRGFGGSVTTDVIHHVDTVVLKHRPRIVVYFCGGNDMNAGRSPETVHGDFLTFASKVHAALPETKIVFLSLHLPPGRVKQVENIKKFNKLVEESCAKNAKLRYVSVAEIMLGKDGQPNAEMYRDPLHPTAKAYELWAEKLRPVLKELARQ